MAGHMPTSTAPCDVDSATNKTILKDITTSGYGALQTSNDWSGAYAKLELVAMGLMTAAELEGTADAEAPFCMMPPLTNANYEQREDLSWWYTNLACDNMEFITAQQVEDISTANLKRLVQGQHVRAAIVVVMDGAIAASTPHDTVGDFAADSTLNWWHNYAAEMPGFWHDATYSRSTLSIAVADADKGCGVPLAQCSALTAVDQSVAAVEQAPLDIALGVEIGAADPDSLVYSIVDGPADGALQLSGSTATYTSTSDTATGDSFTFKVTDGNIESNTATVTIAITPVNDAPTAVDQSVAAVGQTPVAITLGATDPEADSLTYSIVDGPANGTLIMIVQLTGNTQLTAQPAVTYTSTSDTATEDAFTFKVNDGDLESNAATVIVTITPATGECTTTEKDDCGVCNGNNDCHDCAGVANGGAALDDCGVCNGNNDCDVACPAMQYRANDGADCIDIPSVCDVGQYRTSAGAACIDVPSDTACDVGQYRTSAEAACVDIPSDAACGIGQYRTSAGAACVDVCVPSRKRRERGFMQRGFMIRGAVDDDEF